MNAVSAVQEIREAFQEWDGADVLDIRDDLERLLALEEEDFAGTGYLDAEWFLRDAVFPNGNHEWPDDLSNAFNFVVMDKSRAYLAIELGGKVIYSNFRDDDE